MYDAQSGEMLAEVHKLSEGGKEDQNPIAFVTHTEKPYDKNEKSGYKATQDYTSKMMADVQ